MIDEAAQAAFQETYGKVISWTLGTLLAALIALGSWVASRQIKRLDVHDVKIDKCTTDISGLREADRVLDMQMSAQITRLEGDLEEQDRRMHLMKEDTDKKIEASEKNTEKYMALMSEHFETLISIFKKE